MCPKGHSLLIYSDRLPGRLHWTLHARGCAACAEVRAAERFVEGFAARAGAWPLAEPTRNQRTSLPRSRRWRLVAALAVLVALLPLAGPALWKLGIRPFHGQAALDETVLEETATTNLKHVAMALQLYMSDYDALPDVDNVDDLRAVMDRYIDQPGRRWFLPGTQEVIVEYVAPPGLQAKDIDDPAATPIVAIEALPGLDLVGFADGHVSPFPKGADW